MPSLSRMSWIAGGDVLVLALDQARAVFDNGDFAAEAAEHLSELQPDIAAPDDHEMTRQKIDLHHRRVGEVRHLVEARDGGIAARAAHVDEDFLRA